MSRKVQAALLGVVALILSGAAFADSCKVSDYGALPVDMVGGRATTIINVNGKDTRFILDSGAMYNSMSRANADSMGLRQRPLSEDFRGSGIGGSYSLELTHVQDFGILGVTLHDIQFLVGGSDPGMGLIGANLLDFADLDIDLAQGKLHLMKPSGCRKWSMAYWATGGGYQIADLLPAYNSSDHRSFVNVTINGKQFRALLDTGAWATLLTRHAAEKAGIDLSTPDVKASYAASGMGARSYRTWTVPIDTFSIGTETIQHSKMQVMDGDIGGGPDAPDMLLGVDFFLAHHIFIANSQEKMYFTYNGGRVFSLAQAPTDSDKQDVAAAGMLDTPKTADDYALRGQAHLARGEPAAALADLDKAITMGPPKAAWYSVRANAHLAQRQSDAAMADLDKAIQLDPTNIDPLLARARLKLRNKDKTGAQSDIQAARQLAPAGSQQSRTVAQFYVATDQPAEALPLLDDWIRLHRDDHDLGVVLNERCWARGLANVMLDKALDDCHKAIRRDGPKPEYLDSMALIQLRQKDYTDAISHYQEALTGRPNSAWSRYGLGLAEIRSGQTAAGNADLAAAKALAPDIEARFTLFGI
jgi:predicted aspartyl protease/tetratricopeptide (TPR) repeat protein